VDIVILYPDGRVSDVQRKQMTTVDAPNVHTVAVEGTFDDCQDLVKAMFNDPAFRHEMNLSAVNSINWARVMAQIVYYVAAIDALGQQPLAFSVPTGNFGNVLAGWIAREMGSPIQSLIVGSNSNDILTRFFESRSMTTKGVTATLSPSMDIQVSSNFERLLFDMNERDGVAPAGQMEAFRHNGELNVTPLQYETWIEPVFVGARCDDETTIETMSDVHRRTGMLIDPHTAVGVEAARRHGEPGVPTVTLATAHPAKFPDAVVRATGVHPVLPAHLADLMERPERTTVLPGDLLKIQQFVRSVARHS
jgi:threonine synthase